jgi:16S rRNA (guanine527-N7)-methyltransferase
VKTLDDVAADFGLDEAQAAALATYLDLLLGWRRGNITAVRSRAEAIDRLLADSLAILDVPALQEAGARWLDLGAGAGVPGIPLAVARPAARVTLLESAAGKCVFLEEAVAAAGLTGRAVVVHARSEAFAAPADGGREAFDVVFARALAGLASVVELAAPLLATDGVLLAVKGARGAEREGPAGEQAARECGLLSSGVVVLSRSPVTASVCAVFHKREPAPDWLPRRPGLATRRPLAR